MYVVVCKCFQCGPVKKFVVGKELINHFPIDKFQTLPKCKSLQMSFKFDKNG